MDQTPSTRVTSPTAASDATDVIERVGIIGCGLMGAGISEVCARANVDVVVVESTPALAQRGRERIERSLARAFERGKVDDVGDVWDRITVTTDQDSLCDRELVIEAIVEDHAAKAAVFASVDRLVQSPTAILSSNTSSIPIARLGAMTSRPEQVVGLHFFNPATVLDLVEVVPSLSTAESTVAGARSFVEGQLRKSAILGRDRAGFVVNALLVPFILSAIRMVDDGYAAAEDVDKGMVMGAAHPQGPLALADLIGLDVVLAVADSLHHEFRERQYVAPPLLRRLTEAGHLGRKTGRGFYAYAAPSVR